MSGSWKIIQIYSDHRRRIYKWKLLLNWLLSEWWDRLEYCNIIKMSIVTSQKKGIMKKYKDEEVEEEWMDEWKVVKKRKKRFRNCNRKIINIIIIINVIVTLLI